MRPLEHSPCSAPARLLPADARQRGAEAQLTLAVIEAQPHDHAVATGLYDLGRSRLTLNPRQRDRYPIAHFVLESPHKPLVAVPVGYLTRLAAHTPEEAIDD